jgi:hypothetical protein
MSNPVELFKQKLIGYHPNDKVVRAIIWDFYSNHHVLSNCPKPDFIIANRLLGSASCPGLPECRGCGIKVRS